MTTLERELLAALEGLLRVGSGIPITANEYDNAIDAARAAIDRAKAQEKSDGA